MATLRSEERDALEKLRIALRTLSEHLEEIHDFPLYRDIVSAQGAFQVLEFHLEEWDLHPDRYDVNRGPFTEGDKDER